MFFSKYQINSRTCSPPLLCFSVRFASFRGACARGLNVGGWWALRDNTTENLRFFPISLLFFRTFFFSLLDDNPKQQCSLFLLRIKPLSRKQKQQRGGGGGGGGGFGGQGGGGDSYKRPRN